jgi:hypothetical protein
VARLDCLPRINAATIKKRVNILLVTSSSTAAATHPLVADIKRPDLSPVLTETLGQRPRQSVGGEVKGFDVGQSVELERDLER